jgi:hypothetical protein
MGEDQDEVDREAHECSAVNGVNAAHAAIPDEEANISEFFKEINIVNG